MIAWLKQCKLGIASVCIPLLAYLGVCYVALDIYIFSEPGSRQYLTGIAVATFGLSVFSSFCAVLLGMLAMLREHPRYFGLFGVMLGLIHFIDASPFHLGGFLIRIAARAKGFDIYPS